MENIVCYLPELYHGPASLDCLPCLHCTIILWGTLGTINGTINPGGLIALVVGTFLCHEKEMGMTSK